MVCPRYGLYAHLPELYENVLPYIGLLTLTCAHRDILSTTNQIREIADVETEL